MVDQASFKAASALSCEGFDLESHQPYIAAVGTRGAFGRLCRLFNGHQALLEMACGQLKLVIHLGDRRDAEGALETVAFLKRFFEEDPAGHVRDAMSIDLQTPDCPGDFEFGHFRAGPEDFQDENSFVPQIRLGLEVGHGLVFQGKKLLKRRWRQVLLLRSLACCGGRCTCAEKSERENAEQRAGKGAGPLGLKGMLQSRCLAQCW